MKRNMISDNLKNTLPFFKIVSRLPERSRKLVLNELGGDKQAYDALHEIAYNTLKGNVKLKKSHKLKLKHHHKVLNKLCCKTNKKCWKKRKQLVVQSGGFLPILIPSVVAAITSLLAQK